MKKTLIATLALACMMSLPSLAQGGYKFTTVVSNKTTPIKDQASTGTCWCFATTSFMESELIRMGKGEYDLSEMFIVRQKYINQMKDNFLRQGNGNVGQGSLSHTWMNAFRQVGIVPEEVYHGINYDSQSHNHSELAAMVAGMAKTGLAMRKRGPEFDKVVDAMFDVYLGELPETFTYKGKQYTAKSFAQSLGLDMDDYVEITSFSHKPYYTQMSVEVPDNWEHERQYNVPLDEMIEVMDHALKNGYTIDWDGDVSEKGFSHRNCVAINPQVAVLKDYSDTDRARFEDMTPAARLEEVYKFENPYPEIDVTQEIRQAGYESFATTDDHLMHIVGISKDQNGTKYYITKNSWGDSNAQGGYLNMSESFVRAKTIYVMVHKDALPKDLRKKLGIK